MRKLVAVPSATSPESRCALPDAWVRRIFERMEDRYGDLWLEAIEQMARRESGRDRWSHPAIYWAAAKIGAYELGSKTLRDLNAEWRKAFGDQLALGQWPEIPERLPALPAPGHTHNREVGGETLSEMLRRLKASADAQCKERGE